MAQAGVRGGLGAALGLLAAGWALCATAQAGRVALVIGNGAYAHVAPLANPGNDARAVGDAFERLGYTVTRLMDANQIALLEGLRSFKQAARGKEVAVVFYAGHGIGVQGSNFLVPVDAELGYADDVEDEAIPLRRLMSAVGNTRHLGLVILDACRNNPFVAKMKGETRSIERGLARLEETTGKTMVAYAAKHGSVASDGDGDHSPYTEALLKYLREEPGLPVRELFGHVHDVVFDATSEKFGRDRAQKPWTYGELGGRKYYLASAAAPPPKVTETTTGGTTPDKTPPPPTSGDAARAYEAAERLNTVDGYRAFIKRYPDSFEAELARGHIAKLGAKPKPIIGGGDPEEVEKGLKLSRGHRRLVQMGLAAAGYDPGPADGRFREQTREALRSWQGSKRMEVTGYLTRAQGEELTALGREAESKAREAAEQREREAAEQRRAEAERREQEAAPTPGEVEKGLRLSRGHRRLVQMGLAAAGYAPGPADGRFRGQTRAALRSWQGSKRMEVTGYLTKEQGEELTALGRQMEAERSQRRQREAAERRRAEAEERRQRVEAERKAREAEAQRQREAAQRRRAEAERRKQEAAPLPKDVEERLRLSSEDRRLVQMGLAAAGQAPGPVDGKFGPRTRKALRAWQESKELKGTGYLTREQSEGLAALGREEAQRLQAEAERQRAREAGTTFRDCPECPEMVVVPSGRFAMGSTSGFIDERPVHPVTFARPFAVGVHEVTFAEWDACESGGGCIGYRPDDEGWGRGHRPVINVSWVDAQAYVRWLSGKTGEAYRLLSESEWEYVARAGTTGPYHFGSSISPSQANYSQSVYRKTVPVKGYPANAFGLHDVHGNVLEWVDDCWNSSYNAAPRDGSAWNSGNCSQRVLRGGSWSSGLRSLRSAYRFENTSGIRNGDIGFRVARTLTQLTREQSEGLGGLGREEAERQERERQRAEAERRERVAAERRAREEERRRAEAERKRADDDAFARAKAEGTVSAFDGYLLLCGESCRHGVEARRLRAEAERFLPGKKFQDCARCPEMVVVPEGSFLMGSPEDEAGRDDDEGPVHRVTIARPFAVGVYEVTFSEWDACVSDGGCGGYRPKDRGWGRGRRPVINVSWEDAKAYVEWLSRETGEEYRLLSEAEWEYVARAGTRTRYWWGDKIGWKRASCSGCWDRWGGRQTAPVGSFSANAFGLHDVHGNVNEWVEDCWNESYRGAPSDGSAWESGDCSRRMLRGGHWSSLPGSLRSAVRGPRTILWFNDPGFRVARTLTP